MLTPGPDSWRLGRESDGSLATVGFHPIVLGRSWPYVDVMTKLEIKGDWNIITGKLKQKWAALTDNDLQYVDGQKDELLGRIQKRTGESREAIEKAIKALS